MHIFRNVSFDEILRFWFGKPSVIIKISGKKKEKYYHFFNHMTEFLILPLQIEYKIFIVKNIRLNNEER